MCGWAVVSIPGALYATPAVASVSGSNWTGIGVSVMATNRSPSFTRLTLALSEILGENIVLTRWNSDRHGSVANSE